MDGNNNVSMVKLNTAFEGQRLTFYRFRDKVCIIAAELGRALEYADDGKSLVEVITKRWSIPGEDGAPEMVKGKDFDVLEGEDLRVFKAQLGDTERRSVSFTARLMILTESGADYVCIKTDKPLGKKLRRFLVDEVMPKLRRGEPILPKGYVPANDIEAQVRLLALRQKEALAIYLTARDLFSEDFLRHKVEHAAALVSGERPVVEHPLLAVEGYLVGRGVKRSMLNSSSSVFGKRLKALYIEKYGREPGKQPRDINNAERLVYSYTERDRDIFDRAFEELFGQPHQGELPTGPSLAKGIPITADARALHAA